MKKWQCLVCGWIYDEAMGWPEDGIEPGTKWEDIPDDWTCPDCGVGKEDFEMLEIKSKITSNSSSKVEIDPILIIGSGLAAQNLVKEIRKRDQYTPITMITRDDGTLYYKPNISAALSQSKTPDELILSRRNEIETKQSIQIKPYTSVSSINCQDKTIVVDNKTLRYSSLILATGASAPKLPFGGNASDQVLSVNDLDDYRIYRRMLVEARSVTIVGAGLIGCEFANDLLENNVDVKLVDTMDHCMSRLLPPRAAQALESGLSSHGANFYFGRNVEGINKIKNGFDVLLSDGTRIKADMVVSAVGLKANTMIAENSGIRCTSAIEVNEYLETSVEDIYAIGDCASVKGRNLMFVDPLILCAKALAKTLTGHKTAVNMGVLPVTVKTPYCPVVIALPIDATSGEWEIEGIGMDIKAVLNDSFGKPVGFALTGDKVSFKVDLLQRINGISAT